MTKDEIRNTKMCRTCRYFDRSFEYARYNYVLEDVGLGVCDNTRSDHYGHVIVYYHPACEKYKPKED